MEHKCQKCGCEMFDKDVTINVLDQRTLPCAFVRAFCKSCGATHALSDRHCLLIQEFTWEQIEG